MYLRLILFIGCLPIAYLANAQRYSVPGNALLEHLLLKNGTVQNIRLPENEVLIKLPMPFNVQPYAGAILKDRSGLYLTISGTGQVFRVEESAGDSLALVRMDSTHFLGYNNMSFDFLHRDTLFSFGGYGFWRVNGHLRYFAKGREWMLSPLDRETPFHGSMAYYDSSSSSVFFVQQPYMDEGTRKRQDGYLAGRVDLANRTSRILGPVLPKAGVDPGRLLFSSQSLGGLVVDDFRTIRLLDITNNRIGIFQNQALIDWIFGNSRNNEPILFEEGGKLHMHDRVSDRMDSFPVTTADLRWTGETVFIKTEESGTNRKLLYTAMGAMAFAFFAWAMGRYSRSRRQSPRIAGSEQESPSAPAGATTDEVDDDQAVGFSELDKQLIDTVLKYTQEGRACTVQEVNRVLGVAKKSIEIQKKMRRETLVRINRRFRELTGLDMDLIASRRSEEDKRYYQYMIGTEAMDAYLRIDKGNGTR